MSTIIVFLHSGCTNTEMCWMTAGVSSSYYWCLFFSLFCSREVLQEVLDTDLSNEAFPFSSHKVVIAAGHQVTALTHPLHAHTHVHDGCSTFLCFKITLSVLVKWRMQLIKNATMQIACCWVKRYFLFFFYLKGSVIKDCTLCVGGTDGVSQGVLVTSLHVESVQNLCIFFSHSTFSSSVPEVYWLKTKFIRLWLRRTWETLCIHTMVQIKDQSRFLKHLVGILREGWRCSCYKGKGKGAKIMLMYSFLAVFL